MKDRTDCIFDGKIEHFWRIAGGIHVDWFDYKDFQYQYFLSHAHQDHYAFKDKGEPMSLLTNTFISKLNENPRVNIYCTAKTRDILLKRNTDIDLNIEELDNHVEILNDDERQRGIELIGKTGRNSGKKFTLQRNQPITSPEL